MALSLVVGPAHAGKIGVLLDRFLAAGERDPWLVVPSRLDVDRMERELIARCGGLLAGTVATFDSLFEHLAWGGEGGRRVVGAAERMLLLRRVIARGELNGLARSARFAGFAEALAATLDELEAGLVELDQLEPDLRELARAYRSELDGLQAWDPGLLRRHALDRLDRDLHAWGDSPVLASGFEDLTGAEWHLLEALAGRCDVHVSLPYEPGRAAFASLSRTAGDLAALSRAATLELPPGAHAFLPPSLAHLERHLFTDEPPEGPSDVSIRFLEGAGSRATLELVAREILELVAAGTVPEQIAVVCPSLDRFRAPVESAFGALGVPVADEGRRRLGATAFGRALISLLRFAWARATRRELFVFLRSPYSGLSRPEVDWLEGRLRGRAVMAAERTVEEMTRLRDGRTLPVLALLAGDEDPRVSVRALSAMMLRAAHGLAVPPVGEHAVRDLRACEAVTRLLADLERMAAAGTGVEHEEVLASLERLTVRGDTPGMPGRVALLDVHRIRTRRFEAVYVLGLEQGSLPRPALASPFLEDDARRLLEQASGARLSRADQASRDRYLFYTACTRPTRRLTLVREAATDEGVVREPSPFWEAVTELYSADEVRRQTVRRPLSRLTWRLEEAPTERERLRALASLSASARDEADALAVANGCERRLRRALHAFSRPTRIAHPRALALLGERESLRVTDLERMATCSSAWFVERYLRPGRIDQVIDARLRGSIAHVALQRFYSRLPSALAGAERVTPENVEDAVALVHASVESAVASGLRIDADDLQRRELTQMLQRDLEQLVRDEASARSTFVPRKLEVAFQGYPLADGVAVSGKIDRIDVDPLSARGIVVDYKSGAAPSASQIRDEARLQIPLYLLVLRDQIGLEPMGGVYMPLGGGRRPRGMLRKDADHVPGFNARDYLEGEEFEAEMEHAREVAIELAGRIRSGDVRHDPRGGECPAWCDLWRMCRKERP